MKEILGIVRVECMVLDPLYWRHWDDVVCKRLPADHSEEYRVRALFRYVDEGSMYVLSIGSTEFEWSAVPWCFTVFLMKVPFVDLLD